VADLTPNEWAQILEVHDHRCAYCLERCDRLQQDHVIALARGGAHSAENIVPACATCNRRKSDLPVFVMLERVKERKAMKQNLMVET
jgi:5-methylcytosine-specific restriction endonuclease McrA